MMTSSPCPALMTAAVALIGATTAAAACTDCQLNGECVPHVGGHEVCKCDQGWKGADCGLLNLHTDAKVAYGYTNESKISSWGGGPPVFDGSSGKYQLLVSQIAAHCGMSTWARLSTSVRATSAHAEGPYEFAETIVGTESHNTIYAYSPTDKVHLMYSIFEGTWPQSCNPAPACTDGTTVGGKGLHHPTLPNNTCGGSQPGGARRRALGQVIRWPMD